MANPINKLTRYERARITEIKAQLNRQKAEGADTSSWESEFFLRVIGKLTKGKNQ